MGRQSRKYNPRTRTKRPIGLQIDTEQSPNKPHNIDKTTPQVLQTTPKQHTNITKTPPKHAPNRYPGIFIS